MNFSERYSHLYDLFYQNKNYSAEVEYVLQIAKDHGVIPNRVLELGCGTGSHTLEFRKRGLEVIAHDLNPNMLKIAREKLIQAGLYEQNICQFSQADISSTKFLGSYKFAVCLFHVFNYLSGMDAWKSFLSELNVAFEKDGIFIFDIWFGPAVEHLKPSPTHKKIETNEYIVDRKAVPNWYAEKNSVDVEFQFSLFNKTEKKLSHFTEHHLMTYTYLPQIQSLCSATGWELTAAYPWMTKAEPSNKDWSVAVVLRKS